jgi:Tfp pilus assembly protein PilO
VNFTLGTIDRRTLVLLLVMLCLLVAIILRSGLSNDSSGVVVAPSDSIPAAEHRLERLRQVAATVPGKEEVLKKALAELDTRHAGMLKADTSAQAQAQLIEVIRRVAMANGIDARGAEEMRVKPLANDYGEVSVTVTFNCAIEQLVNFLAALANEPQILATNEINISGGNDKKKNVQVRLGLSAVVPKKLVPVKRGLAAF